MFEAYSSYTSLIFDSVENFQLGTVLGTALGTVWGLYGDCMGTVWGLVALRTAHFALHTSHFTLRTSHFTLHTSYFALHTSVVSLEAAERVGEAHRIADLDLERVLEQ